MEDRFGIKSFAYFPLLYALGEIAQSKAAITQENYVFIPLCKLDLDTKLRLKFLNLSCLMGYQRSIKFLLVAILKGAYDW